MQIVRFVVVTIAGVLLIGCVCLAQSAKPIFDSERYSVFPDRVTEGCYSAIARSATEIVSNYPVSSAGPSEMTWKLQQDISKYPQLKSDYVLLDAIYNLSLSDLAQDTTAGGTFDAGAKWPGVWTRDVSYSILLALAAIQPDLAKRSLMRKVKRERIVQDTGTGGSWPVSSDRVTWAVAAWEVYAVTGDREWLQRSYGVIRNSIADDEQVVMDPGTGLARGETSFMDWREQTYPRWMEPADIFSSKAVGTNAVYYRVYRILASMARELGQPAGDWDAKAERIRAAVNQHFWMESKGYYGEYLYGRVWQTLSPRSDALGNTLAILFDVADPERQDAILRSQPLMPYGIPTVYPQTPNMGPYHNRSVWPFVQALWNWGAAKRGQGDLLLYGLASIYRESALFLTNKENFVADTGSPQGMAVNSDRQLWSVAGNLAMVYRVLFGMEFATDGLHLHPMVPEPLKGTRTLTDFHYRDAVLSLQVEGFGGHVRRFTLDGKPGEAVIPASLRGTHTVVIELDNQPLRSSPVHLVQDLTAPETPVVRYEAGALTWEATQGAAKYQVYADAKPVATVTATSFAVAGSGGAKQYQVAALSDKGVTSFLSAPVDAGDQPITIAASAAGGTTDAKEFVILEQTGRTGLSMTGSVPRSGSYTLAFRYANGSGPVNTENKCALRTLFVDGKEVGSVVLPQRGKDEWNNWGMSNWQLVQLSSGKHTFELRFLPADINMNGEINRAQIAAMVLTPVH